MTSIKKVVAIVLAFLMIFSSASVLASAKVATAFDSDKTALSIETKFFLNDEPVERVKPGDEVKARVYVGTDYYSNDSTLLFFYDKDFFVLDEEYTTGAAVVSNNSGVKGIINPNPDLSSQAYLTADYLEQYGAVLINLEVASINNVMYDASDWLFEIAFTVKDTAGSAADDITGDLFVNPATIQNTTEEGFDAVVTVPKGPSDGTDADLWPMFLWDADVTLNSTPVTSESTVTFNANGGAFETGDADSQSYTGTIETDAVPVQAQPVRSGYTFLGWDDASDETETAAAQPEKFQREDLVLNAVWVKNVNITFETDGGTEIPALLDKTPGTEFPAITDPTKPGYTFRGWDPALPEVYPTEDTTYNAIWKLNVTMTFDTLGGTEIAEQKGYAGQEFDPATIANPTKPGYSFRGWSPALPTAFPEEDTTYTAIYEEKLYSVEYYVVENGVATLKRVSRVEFNKEIPTDIINDLIPEGYALNGWYTDEACQTKLEDGKVMEGTTLKLYATFEVQSYYAIFNAAGGYFDGDESKTEVPVKTVFDEPITAPAAPVREGYIFKGWTPAVGVMDTVGGKTFKAQWQAIEGAFTATYYVDGEVYEEYAIAAGDSLDVPQDPDKKGYEFLGWAPASVAEPTESDIVNLEGVVMPAENLEYNAVFKAVSADVTFYEFEDTDRGPAYNTDSIGYEVYNKEAYIFGDTFKILEAPALVNTAGQSIDAYYTFLHWVDDEGNTYEAGEEIEMKGEINFYPVYERVTVKLVPVEGSTTMIERYVGGAEVIESYNDGYSVTADRYTADAGFDKWYIYGLAKELNNSNGILDNYIKVSGDGYYDVEYVSGTDVGTGVKISVYDNFDTSAPVEEFHIIIFGDVTGDGYIEGTDVNLIRLHVNSFAKFENPWELRAADVTGDRYIEGTDVNLVRLVVNSFEKLDQVTGCIK